MQYNVEYQRGPEYKTSTTYPGQFNLPPTLGDGQDILLRGHADGIGDQIVYTQLPRIYKQAGHKVYVLAFTGPNNYTAITRNPEVKHLLWELNPYIDGFIDDPSVECNVGSPMFERHNMDLVCRQFQSNMACMLHFHDLPYEGQDWPSVYYTPQKSEAYFFGKVVAIPTSVSQPVSARAFDMFVHKAAQKWDFNEKEVIRLEADADKSKTWHGRQSLAQNPVYTVSSLTNLVDIMCTAKHVLTTEAGPSAIGAAMKGNYSSPHMLSLMSTRTWNHGMYTYRNIEHDYFMTGTCSPDYLPNQ